MDSRSRGALKLGWPGMRLAMLGLLCLVKAWTRNACGAGLGRRIGSLPDPAQIGSVSPFEYFSEGRCGPGLRPGLT